MNSWKVLIKWNTLLTKSHTYKWWNGRESYRYLIWRGHQANDNLGLYSQANDVSSTESLLHKIKWAIIQRHSITDSKLSILWYYNSYLRSEEYGGHIQKSVVFRTALSIWIWLKHMSHGLLSQITRFMGPTWGPSGADRTQVGPMLAPWKLLSGMRHL